MRYVFSHLREKKSILLVFFYEWGPQDIVKVSSNFATKFEIVCTNYFNLTQCLKINFMFFNEDILPLNRYILNDNFLNNHGDLEVFLNLTQTC